MSVCILLFLTGCGYYSYHAYYIPHDKLAFDRREKLNLEWLRWPDEVCGKEVLLFFSRPHERGNRECFSATVLLASDTAEQASGWSRGDASHGWQEVIMDTIMVRCTSAGLSESLPLHMVYSDEHLVRYESARICLSRKHEAIQLVLTAKVVGEYEEVLNRQVFTAELVRWEDRNWLGLE